MTQFRPALTDAQEQTARYRNWDGVADLADDDDDDPDSENAYTDLIQRDPVVCDTCFLFRYDVLSCEWWRGSFGWMTYEKWTSVPGTSEAVPRDETPTSGMTLVCKNCGTSNEKHRPIPAHYIDEYVGNLSSTLRSKGVEHDSDVLLSTVLERNTPENQGKQDTHVFAPAVSTAIRHVQKS